MTARAWAVWIAFYAVVALSLGRPWHDAGEPAAATIPDRAFSADRAFVHVDALAGTIGRRVAGTAPCAKAADYIEAELRRLGVETERQVASGRTEFRGATYVYRGVTNVLARIPGRSRQAILVSAHYDSAPEGPGAGDNALAVAAALEIVRALHATGAGDHTILVNFNGGEELGLLGAAAFVGHPWFADVVRFINLDASGGQGRQLLLRVPDGGDDLVEAYAASAPHVHGTVLAQEIFDFLPFDTDYRVYHDAGVAGLDLAPYGDNFAYHTALDRADRISRRTLQETGDNVLAIVRGLGATQRAEPGTPIGPYYDLLGLVMVHYAARTATVVGLLVAALALVLACWPIRSKRSIAMLALGVASVALSTLLAVAIPIAAGLGVTLAGKAMAWYARPWLAAFVYGTFALAGVLAGQRVLGWFARRRGLAASEVADAYRRGLVLCWAAVLALTSALGVGAAYLPLWWCAGAAIAMLASRRLRGALCWVVTLGGLAMAAVTTAQAAQLLLTSLVPLTGVLGPGAPAELVIAAVSGLVLAPFAVVLGPVIQASSPRRVAAVVAVAAGVALVLVAVAFPYTPARPKRVYAEVHASAASDPRLVIETTDAGPPLAMTTAPLAHELARAMPTIESVPGPGSSTASVRLVATGAYFVDVKLDGRTAGWSLGNGASSARRLRWVGTSEPLSFQIDRAGNEPVHVHLTAYYLGDELALDHDSEQAIRSLPSWTTVMVQTVLEASATL